MGQEETGKEGKGYFKVLQLLSSLDVPFLEVQKGSVLERLFTS